MEIVREVMKESTIKDIMLLKPKLAGNYKIGYMRLLQFNEPTARELADALDELEDRGMEAFVLDLRNNPGGLLELGDRCLWRISATQHHRPHHARPGRLAEPTPLPHSPRFSAARATTRSPSSSTTPVPAAPRSSRAPSRTSSAPSSSARPVSAKAACRASSRWGATPGRRCASPPPSITPRARRSSTRTASPQTSRSPSPQTRSAT